MRNDDKAMARTTTAASGIPSNGELAERMATVESEVQHTNERLEQNLSHHEERVDAVEEDVEEMRPWTTRLRIAWTGGKWILATVATTGALSSFGIF